MEKKNNLTFWDVFAAVVSGLFIFQWLNEHKNEIEAFPWWVFFVAYIVVRVGWEQWQERKWWKEHDKKELEFVKSQGYESWAEYMVDHGYGEDVRKSWEEAAAEEKRKREKRND